MNSLSVSGKKWILSKYNEKDSAFIKETFSLDEITSKLLSIRNIHTVTLIQCYWWQNYGQRNRLKPIQAKTKSTMIYTTVQ